MAQYFKADIVLSGYAALMGSKELLEQNRETLTKKYPPSYLGLLEKEPTGDFSEETAEVTGSLTEQRESWRRLYETEGVAVGKEGLNKALRELADRLNTGIRVEQDLIPLHGLTVEICNELDKDPYGLDSRGCRLYIAPSGYRLVRELTEKGIFAAVIGMTIAGNDKVVINGEAVRYLTK